ncbi:MAG: hypothetical protein QXQ41_05085 [Candidatus Bathyarchaeia archaeon]
MKGQIGLAFAALFLAVLLAGSLSMQSEVLTVRFFPTVTKENEPLVITATLNNVRLRPQKYLLGLYVDGEQVATTEALLEPAATQSFTYTRASPKTGEALRIYVEAVNLNTGEKYREYLNIPQSPPELWISFSAFSSFARSLTSTTSTTITTTSTTTTTQITSTGKLQLKLNKVEYEIAKEETDPNIWKITLEYTNTDTTDITIEDILVNNNSIKAYPIEDQIELPITLAKGSTDILTFKIPASKDYKPNQTIEVKLKSTTGTEYSIQILLKY